MSELLTPKEDKNFIKVLASDGTLRMEVPENTEGAIKRDYETSDGKTGTKYELVFSKIAGYIKAMDIYEGDYGKNLLVTFSKNDEELILSLGVATPFGEDFMKKLPNVDLSQEVSVQPFNFDNDEGKTIKGVSIKQNDEKLQNYYFDKDKQKPIHKMPAPEGDTSKFDKDDWKAYFLKVRKFLVGEVEKFIEKNNLAPQTENKETSDEKDDLSDF